MLTTRSTDELARALGDELARSALLDRIGLGEPTWTTAELQESFTVEGFGYGYCVVRRKADGVRGLLDFDHFPRFYYHFVPHVP